MLLRQFCFNKNLMMLIRENTDFPRENPWRLLTAETSFEGSKWNVMSPNFK